MKKIMKMLVLGILVISIVSTYCVGVSAEEIATYEFDDGVKLIVSNASLNTSSLKPRVVDTSFSVNLPVYPSSALVANNLTLSSGETKLEMIFNRNTANFVYISLYDLTDGRYITNGSVDGLYGPATIGDVFTFTGLTSGHKYRIRMSAFPNVGVVSGTITSY